MRSNNLVLITLVLLLSAKPALAQQSELKIYGYFDFEAEVSNKDAAGKIWTFDQHHLNIITIYPLDYRFRVFGEIEWEHGPVHESSKSTGTIYLARAFLEYTYSDAFKVRAGKFVFPFGIYNERYDATFTFMSTILPSSIYGKHLNSVGHNDRLFARYGTGIWVLGTVYANHWEIEYHVYLSNGRGPQPDEIDNNPNKGTGGRLVVSPPLNNLHVGVSYYSDKDGNSFNTKQSALGVDVGFDDSSLKLESELLIFRGEKVDARGFPNGTFQEGMGYYVQGGYTFFEQLTPFVRYDFFDSDIDKNNDGESDITLGLNFSIASRVFLKSEVHFERFQDTVKNDYELFIASVAVAF